MNSTLRHRTTPLRSLGLVVAAAIALALALLVAPAVPGSAAGSGGDQTTKIHKKRIKPGKACPNPAVWDIPVHTKKYGWMECKLDQHGSNWHWRHIHKPAPPSMTGY